MSVTKSIAMGGVVLIFSWSRAIAPSLHSIGGPPCSWTSPSASTFSNSSTFTSRCPRSRANSSAICLIIGRMNSGTVSNRSCAAAVQGIRPFSIWPAAAVKPASPPIRPIIWFLNWSRISAVISRCPSSRAFFSASRFTIPRRNTGARSIRLSASSVQTTSDTADPSLESKIPIVCLPRQLLVQELLQFLAGLEERDPFRRDGYGRARLGIAPFFHAAGTRPETSEPSNLGFIPPLERIADAIKDRIDHDLRLPFREGRHLLRNLLDDLRFRHTRPPAELAIDPLRLKAPWFDGPPRGGRAGCRLESHQVLESHACLEIESGQSAEQTALEPLPDRKPFPRLHHFGLPFNTGQISCESDRVIQIAQFVYQFHLSGLPPREDAPVGQRLHLRLVKRASFRHRLDELTVHVVHDGLEDPTITLAHLPQGRPDILVLAAFHNQALHPDFLQQPFQVGQFHDDADAPGESAGIGDDAIGCSRDVVPARGRHGPHGRDDHLVILIPDPLDRVVDFLGRHDASAGTIDANHDRFHGGVIRESLQLAHRLLRVQNHTLNSHQGDAILTGKIPVGEQGVDQNHQKQPGKQHPQKEADWLPAFHGMGGGLIGHWPRTCCSRVVPDASPSGVLRICALLLVLFDCAA